MNRSRYMRYVAPLPEVAGLSAVHVYERIRSMAPQGVVEARFVWLGNHPLMVVTGRKGRQITADPTSGVPTDLHGRQQIVAERRDDHASAP